MNAINQVNTAANGMKPEFNPEASVFVAANAGAGKTSMLTSRVLSLLLHGAHPSKILCLTYTKAAAGEMVTRVLTTLGGWVMADDAVLNEKLAELLGAAPNDVQQARARSLFAKVLEAPEGLRIQTIHSFCQSLLGRFPVEAGINPHFNVVDTRTEQELLLEAKMRLLSHAQHHDKDLQAALFRLAGKQSEASFNKLIEEIVGQKRSFAAMFSAYGLDGATSLLWRAAATKKDMTFDVLAEDFLAAQPRAELKAILAELMASKGKTDQKRAETIASWLERPAKDALKAYASSYLTLDGRPKKVWTNALPENVQQVLFAEQERVVALHTAWMAHELASHSEDVLNLAEALLSHYRSLKDQRGQMDYDDLILSATALLTRQNVAPWVLFKLDGGIDHILVDEAQDTSAEQWQIINAITQEFFAGQTRTQAERSLFIVGDEKQSIYSFQGADPTMLGRMQAYFKQRINDAGKQVHSLQLIKSYRSTAQVLQAVDAVFAQSAARAGLSAEDIAPNHVAHREGSGHVELWPLTESEDHGEYSSSAATQLARQIADTIAGWLASGEQIGSRGRAITPGDIMILVQTRTSLVDRISRALKKRGIPVAGQDRMELSENLAIQDIIALGQILLLPEDDLTLACVLKSPICNISEDALFELAHARGRNTLWQQLETSEAHKDAYELLADLRAKADYLLPYELFAYALDELGIRSRMLGRMGVEYADPIDEFLMQALVYQKSHTASLQGFIHWLTASKSEVKRDMEHAGGAVRIMTVHGSKGLQAPIVFLPDTTAIPRIKNSIFWHENEGGHSVAIRAPSEVVHGVRENAAEVEKQAMLREYRRLLYVALTRAEDRIYVCGTLSRGKDAGEESWYALVRGGLSSIAEKQGDKLVLTATHQPANSVVASTKVTASPKAIDASWLTQALPVEPLPPRPLSPSRPSQPEPAGEALVNPAIYARGNLMHLLLQHLPMADNARASIIKQQLASQFKAQLTEAEIEACVTEVQTLMGDSRYSFLFGSGALSEVPVTGIVTVKGKDVVVAGQIDKLCITENEVWIVDFKTNRKPMPKNPPAAYVQQLALYRAVLAAIYPHKQVRCCLLWTAIAEMTVLDEALLSTYI